MTPVFTIAIPARYGSTRFPGKPLAELAGRSMLEHVWRRAHAAGAATTVVATDDDTIADAARGFGADVCLTRSDHACGTDRLAEVVQQRGWDDDTIVVNLQGDEPLMPSVLLQQVADDLQAHPEAALATLSAPFAADADATSPHIVKVVTDAAGFALYFSRAPIPYRRDNPGPQADPHADLQPRRHLGLYAYRAAYLRRFAARTPAPLEQAEELEQLRALWWGERIHVAPATVLPGPGVDTPADMTAVEAALNRQERQPRGA